MKIRYHCSLCGIDLELTSEDFKSLTSCPLCEIPFKRIPTQEETAAALQRAKLQDEESIEIGPGARWEDCVLTEVENPFYAG